MKRFNRWMATTGHVRRFALTCVEGGLTIRNVGGGRFVGSPATLAFDGRPDPTGTAAMVAAGRMMRDGVRLVDLTLAQLDTLGRTDLTLPWEDYRQPFDTFAVSLPDDAPACGELIHPCVMILSLDRPAGVFVAALFGDPDKVPPGAGADLMTVLHVEDGVQVGTLIAAEPEAVLGEREADVLRWYTRACMNAALLLAAYPAMRLGPANPEYAARLDRSLKKKSLPEAVRRANTAARRDIPDVYAFCQEVLFRSRREADPDAPEPTPTGREMPCHWRRGHWANVACGEGRTGRRLVFRPPVMVRADRFAGPAAASSVTYRLPG